MNLTEEDVNTALTTAIKCAIDVLEEALGELDDKTISTQPYNNDDGYMPNLLKQPAFEVWR